MIVIEPNVAKTGKYTVTEACKRLEIHRNTLNRYLRAGLVKCSYSPISGKKYFAGVELVKLWRKL